MGTGYTLTATDGAVNTMRAWWSAAAFNITVGAAAKLAFTTQPGGGTGGTAWTTQPAVTVQDAGGNTVTTDTSTRDGGDWEQCGAGRGVERDGRRGGAVAGWRRSAG